MRLRIIPIFIGWVLYILTCMLLVYPLFLSGILIATPGIDLTVIVAGIVLILPVALSLTFFVQVLVSATMEMLDHDEHV